LMRASISDLGVFKDVSYTGLAPCRWRCGAT
jgi:hypothetical protein